MENESEQIIKSVEKDYWQLKKEFPNMDEHWYLANTWLKRYKDTKEGKERSKGLMNFISYQDTFSFSILDSPKSVRAFAFFLLYKEGLKEAGRHAHEFEEITKESRKYQENNIVFPIYKQKNPKTYKKAQIENDPDFDGAPMNLYGYIKGLEYHYNNPEEAKKDLRQLSKFTNDDSIMYNIKCLTDKIIYKVTKFVEKIFKSEIEIEMLKTTILSSPLNKKGENEKIRKMLIDYLINKYKQEKTEEIIKSSTWGVGKFIPGNDWKTGDFIPDYPVIMLEAKDEKYSNHFFIVDGKLEAIETGKRRSSI